MASGPNRSGRRQSSVELAGLPAHNKCHFHTLPFGMTGQQRRPDEARGIARSPTPRAASGTLADRHQCAQARVKPVRRNPGSIVCPVLYWQRLDHPVSPVLRRRSDAQSSVYTSYWSGTEAQRPAEIRRSARAHSGRMPEDLQIAPNADVFRWSVTERCSEQDQTRLARQPT